MPYQNYSQGVYFINYLIIENINTPLTLARAPFICSKSRFPFPEIFSVEWNSIFHNFRSRGQPRVLYSNLRDFITGNFCSTYFYSEISKIFGWMVRSSEIQQFSDTFQGNFRITCPCLVRSSGILGWMESAPWCWSCTNRLIWPMIFTNLRTRRTIRKSNTLWLDCTKPNETENSC